MKTVILAAGLSIVVMAMPAMAASCCTGEDAASTQSVSAAGITMVSSAQLAAQAAQVRLELHALDYSEFAGTEPVVAKEAQYRALVREYELVRRVEIQSLGKLSNAPGTVHLALASSQKSAR